MAAAFRERLSRTRAVGADCLPWRGSGVPLRRECGVRASPRRAAETAELDDLRLFGNASRRLLHRQPKQARVGPGVALAKIVRWGRRAPAFCRRASFDGGGTLSTGVAGSSPKVRPTAPLASRRGDVPIAAAGRDSCTPRRGGCDARGVVALSSRAARIRRGEPPQPRRRGRRPAPGRAVRASSGCCRRGS
jgi:hypothetical protein